MYCLGYLFEFFQDFWFCIFDGMMLVRFILYKEIGKYVYVRVFKILIFCLNIGNLGNFKWDNGFVEF